MNKRKVVLVGIITAALCFAGFVYALTTLSWTQTLKVPTGSFKAYYGATEIIAGSDQTGIWTWNGTTHSFNTTIVINNTGPSDINVAVTPLDLDPIWTPIGFGTQASIMFNTSREVKLSIYNVTASSGVSVGLFTINMTIVP